MEYIFVFNGTKSIFPGGVFTDKAKAIQWIEQNKLTGILNKYPLNTGLYDWARENGYFNPKNENQKSPQFIETFSCASMEHWHFENGIPD